MGGFSSGAFAVAAFSIAAFSFDAQNTPDAPPLVDAFPPASMAARALFYPHRDQALPLALVEPGDDFDDMEQALMLFAVASLA